MRRTLSPLRRLRWRQEKEIRTGLTTDPNDPRLGHGVDHEPIPQHDVYLVLSEADRAAGFVRPVRRSYIHHRDLGGCGTVTTMGVALAETYARQPDFYGATYCVGCGMHRPVGPNGEFYWLARDAGGDLACDDAGDPQKVGT
jgi:hypothetical protein